MDESINEINDPNAEIERLKAVVKRLENQNKLLASKPSFFGDVTKPIDNNETLSSNTENCSIIENFHRQFSDEMSIDKQFDKEKKANKIKKPPENDNKFLSSDYEIDLDDPDINWFGPKLSWYYTGLVEDTSKMLKKLRLDCSIPDFLEKCRVDPKKLEAVQKKVQLKAATEALRKDVTERGAEQYNEMQSLIKQQEECLRQNLSNRTLTSPSNSESRSSPGSDSSMNNCIQSKTTEMHHTRTGTFRISKSKSAKTNSADNLLNNTEDDLSPNSNLGSSPYSSKNQSMEKLDHRSSLPNLKQGIRGSNLPSSISTTPTRPRGIPKPVTRLPIGNSSRIARPSASNSTVNREKILKPKTAWSDGCY